MYFCKRSNIKIRQTAVEGGWSKYVYLSFLADKLNLTLRFVAQELDLLP